MINLSHRRNKDSWSGAMIHVRPGITPELVQQILRPTDRPDEPITTGLPFGPGANFLRLPNETDDRYRSRIASSLAHAGFVTGAVVTFAQRLAEGR